MRRLVAAVLLATLAACGSEHWRVEVTNGGKRGWTDVDEDTYHAVHVGDAWPPRGGAS